MGINFEANIMGLIDLILIPALIASFIYIAQLIKTNSDNEKNKKDLITINDNIKKTNSNLEEKLEENKKTTEHYGEKTQQTITTLANEIATLRKELHENKTQNYNKPINMHIEKTDNVIKSIIKETEKVHAQIGIGTDISETKQLCPECRVEMTDYGWRQTPWGLVWHYRCPNGHGIFPSTKLNDTWDE